MLNKSIKIISIVGARPNFMKIAPIVEAIRNYNSGQVKSEIGHLQHLLVHTGQHYDERMSSFFFNDLGIPEPDINLGIGSSSHAVQTAEIMKKFEDVCLKEKPTHVLVVGDVNSTIACALVASKLGIKIIHVEAGLRSFDRSMPEEINRVLTDAISDLLFTTEESANENLRKEGVPQEKIHFVGNVMIDTLLKHKHKAEQSKILQRLGLHKGQSEEAAPYGVLTLHRPSNVDKKETFMEIMDAIREITREFPIIFPVHPRTLNRMKEFGFDQYDIAPVSDASPDKIAVNRNGINFIEPLGYLDFLKLMASAKLVLTDSGGIQEETTILGVPCVTLRASTERPITITSGTNIIAGIKKEDITRCCMSQMKQPEKSLMPPLWDGNAAERIVDILAKEC